MRKFLFLLIALLTSVSGAWAQLTSISDGGCYTIQFCRTNLAQDPLKVKSNLYHDVQNNSDNTIAAVFQFESAGEADTYYIKEISSAKYVYASDTPTITATAAAANVKIQLGNTSVPGTDSETPKDSQIRYKWVVTYVGSKGTTGTYLWSIKPKENTDVFWAVFSQGTSNPVALYGTNTGGYDHYILGFVQLITPTLESWIQANLTVSQLKAKGYSSADIAEYYKPTKLDVAGWPTTTAYNTFKAAINALADDAVVSTAYETPYNTMCTSYVLPEVGKFYTIYQPIAKKYIHAVTPDNSTNLAANTDGTAADAIFYVPYSGRFLSYTKGYAMSTNKIYNDYYGSGGFQTYTIDHLSTHPLGTLRIKGGNYLAADAGNDYVWTSSYGAETSKYWTFTEVTSLPVTITAAKYASFCAPVAVTIPSGVTAYRAKSIDGSVVTLSSIDDGTIPANTGVILYANVDVATTYNFDITTGGTATSLLTGTTAAVSRPDYSYVLSKSSEGVVGFYGNGATTIPGFKAYYQGAGSVKGYSFRFDDETEVKSLDELPLISEGKMYDLSGRRIVKPTRGLYLSKGQKFVVK